MYVIELLNVHVTDYLAALWLNFYADGTVSGLTLFSVIYATCAVVALSAVVMVLQ